MNNATAFTSPLASLKYGAVNMPPQVEYLVETISQVTGWQIFFTVLGLLVVYDQCRRANNWVERAKLTEFCSHVYLPEGKYRRPRLEDALHRPFPAVGKPQV